MMVIMMIMIIIIIIIIIIFKNCYVVCTTSIWFNINFSKIIIWFVIPVVSL